jgi:D-glycero-D-manno-heptose 1,7-bisphosphate phosphatase
MGVQMSHDYTPGNQDLINQIMAGMKEHQAGLERQGLMKDTSPRRFAPEPERNFKLRPALCLDLDGTVRYSAEGKFINKPDDVRLYDGVEAKLWEYRDNNYLIFGISNQGGVAYGLKTPQGNEAELDAMIRLFKRNPFQIIKCCYHDGRGKVEPFNHRSLLRKPDYGMLVLCEVEAYQAGYIVDWGNSLMVGDRPEDQQVAANAGIEFQWAHEFFGREKPAE